jgi:serine/threonine-protein kinase
LSSAIRDRYHLQGILGKGGFGVVYLAHDRVLDQKVAIKVLKLGLATDTDRRRFIFEARTGAQLRHPAIVNVFDIIHTDEGLQMVMEHYPGGTMSDAIKKAGRIDPLDAIGYVKQIASGLAFAHSRQIIHRDIKPANIFFAGDDIVKLGDFGICARYDAHEHTATGEVMGTPLYMAPEQQRDSTDVDPRSDIFALGMTLYHMVTGRTPRVIDMELVPHELRSAVKKATAEDRKERPVSARQFIAILEQAEKRLEQVAVGPTAPSDAPPPTGPPLLVTAPPPEAKPSHDEDTVTNPTPTGAGAAIATGRGDAGLSWSVVALVAVMMAGFLAVILMLNREGGETPRRDIAAATPAPTAPEAAAIGDVETPAPSPEAIVTPEATPDPSNETPPARAATPTPRPTPTPEATPVRRGDFLDRDAPLVIARNARQGAQSFFEWFDEPKPLQLAVALGFLETAARQNPSEALFPYLMHRIYHQSGDAARAREFRSDVVRLDPDWFDGLERRLSERLADKEIERLDERVKRLVETEPPPSSRYIR